VQNAMNVGVGVSYDLSGILKNATNVKSKARLWKYKTLKRFTDYIKIQVQKAIEDYDFS
jgi:hypothetical protein